MIDDHRVRGDKVIDATYSVVRQDHRGATLSLVRVPTPFHSPEPYVVTWRRRRGEPVRSLTIYADTDEAASEIARAIGRDDGALWSTYRKESSPHA